ncbi:MAG TPA: UDP-N-acetylmuramoyl-L-alanyl-D-glutamate--2,6-diaminopimelate ligase [Trichormus sp.]
MKQHKNKPLKPLLQSLGALVVNVQPAPAADLALTGVSYDSRKVERGNAFFCIPGQKSDGNQFIADAEKAGASCIFTETPPATANDLGIVIVTVSDVRLALAAVADYFFDHPSRQLRLLGVTGTNGKTTTTHLVEHILDRAGKRVGLIGTLGARWEGEHGQREYKDIKHTTPQASDLQELLGEMVELGLTDVAIEVSSHALALKRVAGCDFAVAVLTNITQDHLDFHKTMDHYWRSKQLLFQMLNESRQENKTAIVNFDDPLADEFIRTVAPGVRVWTYGFNQDADCAVVDAKFDFRGTKLSLKTPKGPLELSLRLNGQFNVYNTMAAILISLAEGVDLDTCKRALQEFGGVSGRFEVVGTDHSTDADEPLCIVDYAHTPDGLENVLKAARALVPPAGRLIAVFGCGGDRDSSKRPQMGEIAEKLADDLVVTSDNPRSEDPDQIIADIVSGIKRMRGVRVEADRATAIKMAVEEASDKDVILVAGKGHETYQILRDRTIDFDDRIQVKQALTARHNGSD